MTEPRTAPGGMALTVRGLCFETGGVRILDGIDLDLGPAGCTAIIGFNGAGKSVLLRLLHGLLTPTRGSIHWDGAPAAQARRKLALVLQRPVLLRRSVAANIRYAMAVRGVPRAACDARLDKLLAEARIAHLATRPARVLSGGEQRRVAIAQALATAPTTLLLDEPTTGLDPAAVIEIEGLIDRIRSEGTRVLLVTQDPGQARRLAHDIVFLHHGRIAEHTAAAAFFTQPHSEPARAFIVGNLVP
ncbi:MAG: ATP-binding cassette domain-containing protein [Gammaproteobacteria bacterium]|nr:ATP-binding cassette domain-containing protein [Gammaproteobacteria bacterium]